MRPGQIIRDLRTRQGVSIKELALRIAAAGDTLDRTQLSRIEIGQRTLTAERAAIIARALGVPAKSFGVTD